MQIRKRGKRMLHTEVLGLNKEEKKLEFVQVLLPNNSSFRIHTTHESSASKSKVFTTHTHTPHNKSK